MEIRKGFLIFFLTLFILISVSLGLLLLRENQENGRLRTHNIMLSTNYATVCLNISNLKTKHVVLMEKHKTAMAALQFLGKDRAYD